MGRAHNRGAFHTEIINKIHLTIWYSGRGSPHMAGPHSHVRAVWYVECIDLDTDTHTDTPLLREMGAGPVYSP